MAEVIKTTPFSVVNATNGTESDMYTKWLQIISVCVYCMVSILGVLGNGLVIWFSGFKMKKTVNTVWFFNLAVTDFLFTAFLPLTITHTAMNFHWPFGNFMCKVNATISSLNMFASVYILVVISMDRCVSVVWPVWAQNHRNVRKASYVSLGVWVWALILSAPFSVLKDTAIYNETTVCFNNIYVFGDKEMQHFHYRAMNIIRFFLGFVVPFTLIVCCSAVMIHRLKRNRIMANHSNRPFKITAAVILIFFFCWAPFHIIQLIDMIHFTSSNGTETLSTVLRVGSSISKSLASVNSCLNPVLYVFIGQDFKNSINKSVLSILETAFHEGVCRSYTHTNEFVISWSKEKSEKSMNK